MVLYRMRPVITLSLLRSKYHLPISRAAKELGMGVTVMKKYCRKFGINRWPFRKLNSMTKLISSVQQSNPSGKVALQVAMQTTCMVASCATARSHTRLMTQCCVVQDTLTSLVAEKQGIEKDPCRSMRVQTKKLRQSSFKERYKLKHGRYVYIVMSAHGVFCTP
jgi:RWP-RK domain